MIVVSIIYRIAAVLWLPPTVSFELDQRPFLLSVFFLGRWMQFAAGMLAAYMVARCRKNGLIWSGGQGSLALLGAFALYVVGVSQAAENFRFFPMRDLLLGACYMVLLTAVSVSKTPLRRLFNNQIMVRLAFFSYSIFLLHQTTAWYISEFMRNLLHIPGETRFYLLITVGFLIIAALSYGFFLIFEKPFLSSHLKRAEKAETS